MIAFEMLDPRLTEEALGLLPDFLSERDPRPAKEQFHVNYAHGGGWHSFPGFKLNRDNSLSYPGDPTLQPLARAQLRDELILVYPYSWVAIVQPDRSFEVARLD
jgi:hypothetical protein